MGGTGGGTLATPEAAADAFLMVAVTSWDDLRPPTAAAEVDEEEEEAAAMEPPRGDRMGKPLSLANEGSSFCRGSNLILGMEILKNVSNLTLLIFNGVI